MDRVYWKQWRRTMLIACPVFVVLGSPLFLANGAKYLWNGDAAAWDGLELVAMLTIILACLTAIFSMLVLFFRNTLGAPFICLSLSLLFLLISYLIGSVSWEMRKAAYRSFSERSKPLIRAINDYRRDKAEWPKNLEDLTPTYLTKIPDTGLGKADYHYQYEVTTWRLYVILPEFGFQALEYDIEHKKTGDLVFGDWYLCGS